MDPWINAALGRFAAARYVVDAQAPPFVAVARHTAFELTKFGISENFFVFAQMESLDAGTLRNFSAEAFRCAKLRKTVPLPCGFFESVWCYAVAVTGRLDSAAEQAVRQQAPAKHWAAAEIPVVYDTTRRQLFTFEGTPLWGAAYYAGFRSQIKRLLG